MIKIFSSIFIHYFRSILGYLQKKRDFAETTNQIELYADKISNFQILDLLLRAQQKIVGEIKTELEKRRN